MWFCFGFVLERSGSLFYPLRLTEHWAHCCACVCATYKWRITVQVYFFGLVPITNLSTDAGCNVSRSAKDVVGNLEIYLFLLQTYDMSLMVNITAAKQCASKAVERLRQNSWVSGAILSFDYLVIRRFATLGNILSVMVSSSCLFGDSSSSHENKKSLPNRLNRVFKYLSLDRNLVFIWY